MYLTRVQTSRITLSIITVSACVFMLFYGHSGALAKQNEAFTWPPGLNAPYPDLELKAHTGRRVKLSDFKGKVLLIEPVGMNCPACNAFAGAHKKGGYQGNSVQQGVPSIEELLPRYANGLTLDDDRIVLIHLLLFDRQLQVPAASDPLKWAKHFGLDKRSNVVVLAGDKRFHSADRYQASYQMIPGFQLIDKDFVLRADSTGNQPRHNLFTELLPMIPDLL